VDTNSGGSTNLLLSSDTYSAIVAATKLGLSTSGAERVRIESNGNVGIASTSPGAPLDVNGVVRVTASGVPADYGTLRHTGAGGNFHLDTYGTGSIYLGWFAGSGANVGNGAGAYGPIAASAFNVSSDQRLKTDIESISDGLDRLAKLSGYYFRYKADPTHRLNIGLMAQEVETQYPEVVSVGDGGYKTVNYSALVGPIIGAIGELKSRQDALWQIAESSRTSQLELQRVQAEAAALKARADTVEAESAQLKAFLCSQFPAAPMCRP